MFEVFVLREAKAGLNTRYDISSVLSIESIYVFPVLEQFFAVECMNKTCAI